MSFIKREINRISAALGEARADEYDQLYAAQQALAWALEPNGFKSPYDAIKGTPEDLADCPLLLCRPASLDNPVSDV
jgi:hypothetical protein